MKRNVKESIRRSTNRLTRDGHAFELADEYESPVALREALAELRRLHRARSELAGTIGHPDYFAGGANVDFLDDVAERTFGSGLVRPSLLRVDGKAVAARLVLCSNGAVVAATPAMRAAASPAFAWWTTRTPLDSRPVSTSSVAGSSEPSSTTTSSSGSGSSIESSVSRRVAPSL